VPICSVKTSMDSEDDAAPVTKDIWRH